MYINQREGRVYSINHGEICAFLGINLIITNFHLGEAIGIILKTCLSVPFVSSVMPRTRYADILSNLHVYNNDNIPVANTDKMFKLRPLIGSLNQNVSLYYNPSENLSIDGSMILFKGRSSLKRYNAKKPIKKGYTLWVRADMDGYVSKFNVYQGKTGKPNFDGVPP